MTIEDNLRLGAFLRSDKQGIEQDIRRAYDLFPSSGNAASRPPERCPAVSSRCSPWAGP